MESHHIDVIRLSILLSRKRSSEAETNCFIGATHEQLLAKLVEYLRNNDRYFPTLSIKTTQALNDRGVDVLIETAATKMGLQVKSPFDVSEEEFASKVKRQLTESFSHGLAKWYLLICAPLLHNGVDNRHKISHLVNELSTLKTDYHSVLVPEETAFIMSDTSEWAEPQFSRLLSHFSYEAMDKKKVDDLSGQIRSSDTSFYDRVEVPQGKPALNCNKLNRLLGWKQSKREMAPVVKDFGALYERLLLLPRRSREFLAIVLERSTKNHWRKLSVPAADIEGHLSVGQEVIVRELTVVERQIGIYVDDEEGPPTIVLPDSLVDWPILETIKQFAKVSKISLKRMLVDMDFASFDEG